MKYINLIDQISELDKKRLNNYISCFGIIPEHFIGLDEWLQNWSHSNQKLYRLLGNQLIKSYPYTFTKKREELVTDFRKLLESSKFNDSFEDFCKTYITFEVKAGRMSRETGQHLDCLLSAYNFAEDEIHFNIKFKRQDKKKTLQLQNGMKPIKAIGKVVEYFKDIYEFEGFEEFRIAHSMILNDKVVNGELCISIHPFDFLTMSDNTLKWSSCMSWRESGCYHQGTVEMMNSNNVVCCYLKSNKEPFHFDPKHDGIEWEWNNKRWRILCYVTKDIILSGKAYPYQNEPLAKQVLQYLNDLAKENLNWTYSFGPELYKDMIHINNNNQMEKNHVWIRTKTATKHNIIIDTKGMYNDLLNDHHTDYWCYRNKVPHNKIISVSGKSVCLCCGNEVIHSNCCTEWPDDYNDRYLRCGDSVCAECDPLFECDICEESHPKLDHFRVKYKAREWQLCPVCYKAYVKICPCCGKSFLITKNRPLGYVDLSNDDPDDQKPFEVDDYKEELFCAETNSNYTRRKVAKLAGVYVCNDCTNKLTFETMDMGKNWWSSRLPILVGEPYPAKYAIYNLEQPSELLTEVESIYQ